MPIMKQDKHDVDQTHSDWSERYGGCKEDCFACLYLKNKLIPFGSDWRSEGPMPLLDHFHPSLHGPRRWEGFQHAWATVIAQRLNQDVQPANYFAEPEIGAGPELDLGQVLPVMPLWLSLDLCVPVLLEESYVATCRSLRISA